MTIYGQKQQFNYDNIIGGAYGLTEYFTFRRDWQSAVKIQTPMVPSLLIV